jgi:hypothetical protein
MVFRVYPDGGVVLNDNVDGPADTVRAAKYFLIDTQDFEDAFGIRDALFLELPYSLALRAWTDIESWLSE